jgi:hypothetical protein
MGKFARFGLASLMAVGTLASAPNAFAKGGITTSGPCSGSAEWKLTLSADDPGRIQVEFEVDQGVAGSTWQVRLKDNGVGTFKGQAVMGPGGSFTVKKFATDQAGTDNILAQAKNVATGETCQGTGSI